MRKLVALLLAMGTLALFVIWMPGRDSERQLAVVTEVGGKGLARLSSPETMSQPSRPAFSSARDLPPIASPADRRARTFSPDVPLVASEKARIPQPEQRTVEAKATVSSAGELRVTNGVRSTGPAVTSRLAATQPADDASRYELVRSLQRELRRVGCYWGEIDGSWGGASKRSMAAFTERVNSALPIEQPDYILLSLVQGHAGQACGKGCPTGQAMSDAGRCIPNVVLTKRAPSREPAPVVSNWALNTEVTPAPVYAPSTPPPPLPGRMAIGGPRSGGAEDAGGIVTPPASLQGTYPRDGDQATARTSIGDPPVVVYRDARPAAAPPRRSYAPARSTSRRLTYADVFR